MISSWKWVIIVFHCLNSFSDWFLRFFFSHDYIGVLWLARSCIHPGLYSKLTWFSSSDTNFSNSHQNILTISLGCKHHITNCPYATKKSGVYNLFNLLNINLLLFAQLQQLLLSDTGLSRRIHSILVISHSLQTSYTWSVHSTTSWPVF